MPDLVTRYDWLKFGIRATAVLMIEIGTAGTALISSLPPFWKLVIFFGCCRSLGNFILGFFSDPKVVVTPPHITTSPIITEQ